MRIEQEIFDELAQLCSSPGYAHAIAFLCFRNNIVPYAAEMAASDKKRLFSAKRLIRTEISTLVGLLIKEEIDFKLPPSSVVQRYSDKTEALLEELHHSMSAPMFAGLNIEKTVDEVSHPFTIGEVLREPIFYGGESAYNFQYRDLASKKYAKDDAWLSANNGFSIQSARDVVYAVEKIQNKNLTTALRTLKKSSSEEWTFLPGFIFTSQEVAELSHIDNAVVERVLGTFAVPVGEKNSQFRALNDFNIANASPLLQTDDGLFILFQQYSLVEALYESPFYWMCRDSCYTAAAMDHRGRFIEEFSRERLELVFGKDNVHSNVHIRESKSTNLGEIDVLVLFGNRAIVVQVKSKRLTLEARKGNDGQIRDDFQKSIQASYDQGYACAKLLVDAKYMFWNADSREIKIPFDLKEVYIFCVVSDHYPALSFQARQFLKFETTEAIRPPFVMDVFALDTITEMLQSPLRLLSYVNRRTNYSDKLIATHELTILGYHLTTNLWIDDRDDVVWLGDELSADLYVSMAVRRDGLPGKRTPEGILTRLETTAVGRMIKAIETKPDPATIELGFMLLTLSEEAVIEVSKGIKRIASEAKRDGKPHNFTASLRDGGTGLTIHCNADPVSAAGPRLHAHCEARKYTEKADNWFGLCVLPGSALLRFGINLHHEWKQSAEMDTATRSLHGSAKIADLSAPKARKKTGRNDPCPCGSGVKYKKCCLKR